MSEAFQALIDGFASVFDLVPVRRTIEMPLRSVEARDLAALRGDWEEIGRDFIVALDELDPADRVIWDQIVLLHHDTSVVSRRHTADCA